MAPDLETPQQRSSIKAMGGELSVMAGALFSMQMKWRKIYGNGTLMDRDLARARQMLRDAANGMGAIGKNR